MKQFNKYKDEIYTKPFTPKITTSIDPTTEFDLIHSKPEILKEIDEVIKIIKRKFENDIKNNREDLIYTNWPEGYDIETTIRSGIKFYYNYRKKLNKNIKEKIRTSSFDQRYMIIKEIVEKLEEKNDINKLVVLLVDSLRVNDEEPFFSQFIKLLNNITIEEIFEGQDSHDFRKLKAALNIAGALFAIEYKFRRNENKEKWDNAAELLLEFYKEMGYEGVFESIQKNFFIGRDNLINIYKDLIIDDTLIKTIINKLKNDHYSDISRITHRTKTSYSFFKKLIRKLGDNIENLDRETIMENIKDINGIAIILKSPTKIDSIIEKIINLSFLPEKEKKKIKIQNVEVEIHNYENFYKNYNDDIYKRQKDNINILYTNSNEQYKAIHIKIKIKYYEKTYYLEFQLIESEEQYIKHQYSRHSSHLTYKFGKNVSEHFQELMWLIANKIKFNIDGNPIKLSSIEYFDKNKIIGYTGHKQLIVLIEDLSLLPLAILNPKSKKEIEITPESWIETENRIIISI